MGLSFCTAAGDATRATSREFIIDGHDREVVAQVVRDLGRHWKGPPVRLVLTGPTGSWTLGDASFASSSDLISPREREVARRIP